MHGTGELPLPSLLAAAGVAERTAPAGFAASLGLRLSEGALSGVQVRAVLAGSAAAAAGVSAGDELLAVDDWRLRRLDDAQQWLSRGQRFALLVVRDQRLLTLDIQPPTQTAMSVNLSLAVAPAARAASLRRGWLGV